MGSQASMRKMNEYRTQATAGVVIVGVGILLFSYSMIFQSESAFYIGIVLGVLGVLLYRGAHPAYKKLYKDLFVEQPLRDNFDNVFYSSKGGFSLIEVNDLKLIATGTKTVTEDYIEASYKGVNFKMSDVRLMNMNIHKKYNDTIMFEGRILMFDLPNKFVNTTKVYSDSFYHRWEGGKRNLITMESLEFNDAYDVFSEDAHDVFYLLTPNYMEQLLKLKKKYGKIAMSFEGNRVVVATGNYINNSFDKINWTEKIDYMEERARVQKDIEDVKTIIDGICHNNI